MTAKPLGLLLVLLVHAGCGSCPPCEARAATCPSAAPETAAPAPASAATLALSAPAPAAPGPSVAPPPSASTPVEPPPPPAAPAGSLPEVKVENVGLHIGGGPNDDATKKPFLNAIEQHFDELRACYVKVEDPEKGGTFGVDLHIGRNGGKPSVKQPRTAMKGAEFKACVLTVFESVEFDKPKKGPTVISYSIKYSLMK